MASKSICIGLVTTVILTVLANGKFLVDPRGGKVRGKYLKVDSCMRSSLAIDRCSMCSCLDHGRGWYCVISGNKLCKGDWFSKLANWQDLSTNGSDGSGGGGNGGSGTTESNGLSIGGGNSSGAGGGKGSSGVKKGGSGTAGGNKTSVVGDNGPGGDGPDGDKNLSIIKKEIDVVIDPEVGGGEDSDGVGGGNDSGAGGGNDNGPAKSNNSNDGGSIGSGTGGGAGSGPGVTGNTFTVNAKHTVNVQAFPSLDELDQAVKGKDPEMDVLPNEEHLKMRSQVLLNKNFHRSGYLGWPDLRVLRPKQQVFGPVEATVVKKSNDRRRKVENSKRKVIKTFFVHPFAKFRALGKTVAVMFICQYLQQLVKLLDEAAKAHPKTRKSFLRIDMSQIKISV